MKKLFSTLFTLLLSVAMMAQVSVTFNVDMTGATDFNPDTDVVYITGSIFDWAEPGTDPDNQTMTDEDGDMIYTTVADLAAGDYMYKYFLNDGWDGGEWMGDPNREVTITEATIIDDYFGSLDGPSTGSFTITHEGETFTNGQVVEYTGEIGMETLIEGFVVTNTSDMAKDVFLKKVYNSVGDGDQIMMCWGLCYAPSVMVTPDPVVIDAGASSDELAFSGHYTPAVDGSNEVVWVFFDGDNPDDSISFISTVEVGGSVMTYPVTFNVDMTDAVDFDPATDVVYVTGDILGWAEPGTDPTNQTMTDEDGDMIYTKVLELASGDYMYKYFLNDGWDGGEWESDPNRMFTLGEEALVLDNVWGNKPLMITFNVDMSTCDSLLVDVDALYITGSFLGWAEPGSMPDEQTLTDEDGDLIYTASYYITAGEVQYKYFLNMGWDGGEWTGEPNRVVEITTDSTFNDVWGSLSIEENNIISNVNVYPNPVGNTLTIDGMENINTVEIYNLAGQRVEMVEINAAKASIQTANLSSGVYFVIFTDENNNQGALKVIKN